MLERVIEASLFVAPFLAYFAWRLVASARMPPIRLIVAGIVVAALMLISLVWVHQQDQGNADHAYVPAELRHGEVVGGRAGAAQPPRSLDGHEGQD